MDILTRELGDELDLETLVSRRLLQEALLNRLDVDTRRAKLRLEEEEFKARQLESAARLRSLAVLMTSAVVLSLLVAVRF